MADQVEPVTSPTSVTPVAPVVVPPPTPVAAPVAPTDKKKGNGCKMLGLGCLVLVVLGVVGVGVLVALGAKPYANLKFNIAPETDVSTDGTQYGDEAVPSRPSSGDDVSLGALPAAPTGFVWVRCDLGASFLQPIDWFKLDEGAVSTNNEGCFISKEEIVNGGVFKTGLTVFKYVVTPPEGKTMLEAAKLTSDAVAEKAKVADEPTYINAGGLTGYWRTMVIEGPVYTNGMYHLALGDSATDTLYIVVYEAPIDEWKESWAVIGNTIINNMIFGG